MNKKILAGWAAPLLLAGSLVAGTAQAADEPPPQPDYGGMMGGGYGYGPGMMGGYGHGYGPGMMWGDGYGRGPYGGGHGYGWGMMGGMGPLWSLNLTDKQRTAILNIMEEQHKANWPLMGQLLEEQSKLNELYNADKLDSDAIIKAYDRISKVKRAMIETNIKTRNRIMDQLTPEQREQLKRYRWHNQ